ncbi:MAG: DUF2282 domain-containing protein [Alphaproteobacteria bacterium]|nr:DUF2282 domain-containing protein [Alphaproteobacteria bacterium]
MNKKLVIAALAGIMASSLTTATYAAGDANKEKCYGIAKAGKNECKAADGSHSCAGQATKDNDPNDWMMVNKGECTKMGGMLKS